jgi:hypothetical protein
VQNTETLNLVCSATPAPHSARATALPSPEHPRSPLKLPNAEARDNLRDQEMRAGKPLPAAVLDAAAAVPDGLLPGNAEVRRGDYHVILRKR